MQRGMLSACTGNLCVVAGAVYAFGSNVSIDESSFFNSTASFSGGEKHRRRVCRIIKKAMANSSESQVVGFEAAYPTNV